MANPILHKSSAVASAVPAAASLTVRELAINTADGRLFTKTGAGTVVEFARKDLTLAPTGSAAGLTGMTSAQVIAALGYTPGNAAGASVTVISANTTAVAGGTYVLTANLTLTLPASPVAGNTVTIANRSGVLTCVVGRNAQNIMGIAQDMTLDAATPVRLVFADATRGWVCA